MEHGGREKGEREREGERETVQGVQLHGTALKSSQIAPRLASTCRLPIIMARIPSADQCKMCNTKIAMISLPSF